jgi:hypothetical protein
VKSFQSVTICVINLNKVKKMKFIFELLIVLLFVGENNSWAMNLENPEPGSFHQGVPTRLELFPGNGEQLVMLPFPYATGFTEADMRHTTVVCENFACVLIDEEEGAAKQYAMVGPISTCFCIGVRMGDRSVVFHKFSDNSVENLVIFAKSTLNVTEDANKNDISVLIFANNSDIIDHFAEKHAGNTQEQEMAFIKTSIVSGLGVLESQVNCIFHKSNYKAIFTNSGELGQYVGANMSLLVDSKLHMQSISYIKEGFFLRSRFNGYSPTDFTKIDKRQLVPLIEDTRVKHARFSINVCFTQEEEDSAKYNTLPFRLALSNDEINEILDSLSRISSKEHFNSLRGSAELRNLGKKAVG